MQFFSILSVTLFAVSGMAAPIPSTPCGDGTTLVARQCDTGITRPGINCSKPANQWNSEEQRVCASSQAAHVLSTRQFPVTRPHINCSKPADQWNSEEKAVCGASQAAHARTKRQQFPQGHGTTRPGVNCDKPADQWDSEERQVCGAGADAHAAAQH